MNYLFEAAQTLGIYYTPSHILEMGYGDGKTAPFDTIAGNPPFGGCMIQGTERYRHLLRRWILLEVRTHLTPAEEAEKALIEAELERIEMGWGR